MKKALLFIAIVSLFINFKGNAIGLRSVKEQNFNIEKDLLLVQFDCKTDVDDLHTIAAMATLILNAKFSKIQYHAVAGTYGTQKGLYVPPNDLLKLCFGNNWTDANENFNEAIKKVKTIVLKTLVKQGDIWIAEAGQSDFTAKLIKAIQIDLPKIDVTKRIHVVQHSDWNEKHTSAEHLKFIKENSDYKKIPDGNVVGNGTPGFCDPKYTYWKDKITNPKLFEIWKLATNLSNKYNGKEGRYNNKAISAGGMDFSDFSEVCWILGLKNINDIEQFFNTYSL
ncbi:hypothetical protein BWZ22_12440 [Seonamhaeicola sp. S2-3]|uniref:hypothetical protein n=1 Tax=Seonamhaeicola sp. S2-3 TaxID=1936081 RepID=UPI000972E474|nr:hypothetical protein [Seonamhaeicola sp. S2-3]APY11988.1 hypothetical protein BWZ22_12440 [Seonamhaeicola sp. S2-3]